MLLTVFELRLLEITNNEFTFLSKPATWILHCMRGKQTMMKVNSETLRHFEAKVNFITADFSFYVSQVLSYRRHLQFSDHVK